MTIVRTSQGVKLKDLAPHEVPCLNDREAEDFAKEPSSVSRLGIHGHVAVCLECQERVKEADALNEFVRAA